MKPIIVTYSNESWIIEQEASFVFYSKLPFYLCSNSLELSFTVLLENHIKLIARPKNKTTC